MVCIIYIVRRLSILFAFLQLILEKLQDMGIEGLLLYVMLVLQAEFANFLELVCVLGYVSLGGRLIEDDRLGCL